MIAKTMYNTIINDKENIEIIRRFLFFLIILIITPKIDNINTINRKGPTKFTATSPPP